MPNGISNPSLVIQVHCLGFHPNRRWNVPAEFLSGGVRVPPDGWTGELERAGFPPLRDTQVYFQQQAALPCSGAAADSTGFLIRWVTETKTDTGLDILVSSESINENDVTSPEMPDHLLRDAPDHRNDQPRPLAQVELTDVAYVTMTSGSTGKPKGIVNAHVSAVCDFVARVEVCTISPSRQHTLSTPKLAAATAGIACSFVVVVFVAAAVGDSYRFGVHGVRPVSWGHTNRPPAVDSRRSRTARAIVRPSTSSSSGCVGPGLQFGTPAAVATR